MCKELFFDSSVLFRGVSNIILQISTCNNYLPSEAHFSYDLQCEHLIEFFTHSPIFKAMEIINGIRDNVSSTLLSFYLLYKLILKGTLALGSSEALTLPQGNNIPPTNNL